MRCDEKKMSESIIFGAFPNQVNIRESNRKNIKGYDYKSHMTYVSYPNFFPKKWKIKCSLFVL